MFDKNGSPAPGTPLARLSDAAHGASGSVQVHAGDVLDLCSLVKGNNQAARSLAETAGKALKPGEFIIVPVGALKALIDAVPKGEKPSE